MSALAKSSNLSALLIAYQRPTSTRKIIENFLELSTGRLYLTLDFPKDPVSIALENYNEIKSLIQEMQNRYPRRITFHNRDVNVGCAASILSSVDWFFENEEEGVILEDDCIPSRDFFIFSEDAIAYMRDHSDVLLSCGTQFSPSEITKNRGFKSKYILTWGWASTRIHWNEIRRLLIESERVPIRSLFETNIERQYWRAGARRAYKGFVDVWDTVLVNALQLNGKFAILPGDNLVTNVGVDDVATHTGSSPWVSRGFGQVDVRQFIFSSNPAADDWLKNKFFGISLRHMVTTRYTHLKDFLYSRKKFTKGLICRWNLSKIN